MPKAYTMRIKIKFVLTFLVISIIPIVFISIFSFTHAQKSLKNTALQGLHMVALAKKAEVMEYLSGKKGRTIDFASDGFIRDQAEFISQAPESTEKIRASRELSAHLRINKKSLDEEILEIRVFDLDGKIIGASEGEYLLGLETDKNQPYFLEGLHNIYTQDSAIFMYRGAEEAIVAIGAPLKSRTSDKLIGVLVNFYTLANIQDVLLGIRNYQWDEESIAVSEKTTRDIFLVNQKGLLLTPSKKLGGFKPLKTKVITEPVTQGTASSLTINNSWLDSRGTVVLGATALLGIERDWKWLLVIEQDKNEVLKSVYELRNFSIETGLAALLLVVFIGFVTGRSIVKPIHKATEAAEKISKGDAWVKIDIASRDEIGELAQSFNRMVEKRQKIEEELRLARTRTGEEKIKCEMVLASIGDGMVVVNQDGMVMMMNHEAESMFGWELIDIVGKNFTEALTCEDEKGSIIPCEERIMAQSLAGNKTIHANGYYYRKDSLKFPVSTTASPIIFEEKVIGAIGIFRDITKEKEVDRMKTDFVSTVSHEIRTPLTTIREGVSQALDGILGNITEKQREIFSIVLEDADRLKRIIDNLLDISKIEAGKVELKKELVDMAALVKAVAAAFSLQAREKGLKIQVYFSQPKIKAYVDNDRVTQVFTNLVGNALKFTGKGFITISLEDKTGILECAVSDTGKGMAKDDLSKLFSKFQQFGRLHGPGEKGTGLGLSICKGIIELHQGKIWAESELTKGTKISFSLPLYTRERLFKEYIARGIKKVPKEKKTLSILLFTLTSLAAMPVSEMDSFSENLMGFIRKKIHWDSDAITESGNCILMLLSGVKKEDASAIAGKIRRIFGHYAQKKGWDKHLAISAKVISYPEDGISEDELVFRILSI